MSLGDVRKAGYGTASWPCAWPVAGVLVTDELMTRLLVLAEGVLAAGVLRDEVVTDRVLSLLRERLDDEGEMGTPAVAMAGSVLTRTPLSFALRRRARSLCSLKKFAVMWWDDSGSGNGGTGKFEDGMVTRDG
jgi:hypothetical protein